MSKIVIETEMIYYAARVWWTTGAFKSRQKLWLLFVLKPLTSHTWVWAKYVCIFSHLFGEVAMSGRSSLFYWMIHVLWVEQISSRSRIQCLSSTSPNLQLLHAVSHRAWSAIFHIFECENASPSFTLAMIAHIIWTKCRWRKLIFPGEFSPFHSLFEIREIPECFQHFLSIFVGRCKAIIENPEEICRRQCDMHCSLFGKLIPHISRFASFFILGAGALCALRVNRMQIFQNFIEFIRLVLFTLAFIHSFIHSTGAQTRDRPQNRNIAHGTRLMLTRERFIRIDFMKHYW